MADKKHERASLISLLLDRQIMAFWFQQQQLQQQQRRSQTLTQKLRAYSARHVKISTGDMAHAKYLITECVEKEILRYCMQKSSLPILRLEYRGSMYEGLKTEAADEADLMVVIKATEAEVVIVEAGIPGYAFLRAGGNNLLHSPFLQVCSWKQECIIPSAVRYTWFRNLVSGAVYDFQRRFPSSQYTLSVVDHGPAVQLNIYPRLSPMIKPLLSVDLVPCFHIKDKYFVPKPYNRWGVVANRELLWKQSFSLQEKQRLQYMDREDHGCRHELLRIIKTIVKKDCILRLLSSYHVKHAFLHYLAIPRNWSGVDSLGDHFLGFMGSLCGLLTKGSIPHFWEPHFNILENMPNPGNISLVAFRCATIINSEEVRNAVLND